MNCSEAKRGIRAGGGGAGPDIAMRGMHKCGARALPCDWEHICHTGTHWAGTGREEAATAPPWKTRTRAGEYIAPNNMKQPP